MKILGKCQPAQDLGWNFFQYELVKTYLTLEHIVFLVLSKIFVTLKIKFSKMYKQICKTDLNNSVSGFGATVVSSKTR